MIYPLDGRTNRRNKKLKVKRGGLFSLKHKPFAVSSESFQYEHGSLFGEQSYKNFNAQGVSTLKRASVGTDIHYGIGNLHEPDSGRTVPDSLRSKSGGKYLNNLSDSQFRLLYSSGRNSLSDSSDSSVYSGSLYGMDFHNHSRRSTLDTLRTRVSSNPPILVSRGPVVRCHAPGVTNLHMIYTEEDYSRVYDRDHQPIPIYGDNRQHSVSSIPTSSRTDLTPGSYTSEVQYIDTFGRLVSYRLIRPKVRGAPVSVIVDEHF